MEHPKDPKTDPTHLAPIYCQQPKPEEVEPVRCRECNRPLKTEASVTAGIGPTCAKKLGMLDLEFTPLRKGRKIPVDPNQLRLFDAMEESAEGALESTTGSGGEQPLDGPGDRLGCTMRIEVTITCPGGHPSLQVAIAQGGAPCRGC